MASGQWDAKGRTRMKAELSPTEVTSSGITREEQRAQLQKVLHSEAFHSSPGLQKFLEHVATKTIDGMSQQIKEYTIGIEVFGRSDVYDPKIDTVVRVQAHRLREKLKEYYSTEGIGDPILLVIPKGHYIPFFSWQATASNGPDRRGSEKPEMIKEASPTPSKGDPIVDREAEPRNKTRLWVTASIVGIALLSGLGFLLPRLNRSTVEQARTTATATRASHLDSPLRDLWSDYLDEGSSPLVAFSNTEFLVTETSDLLRLKTEEVNSMGAPASNDLAHKLAANPRLLDRAGPLAFQDVYTGTGEVMSVYYLTRLFTQYHEPLGVKRIRLVTTDDLTRHAVVFLGSTREDALLEELHLPQDFVFAWPPKLIGVWSGQILNLHPKPGESSSYMVERDPKTHVLRTDYALVSFLPGIAPDRRIAILGGLTTLGTQAAAEFATSPTDIAELAARLDPSPGPSPKKIPPFFQAVLKVEIMKGDVLSVKYVTGHVLHPAPRVPPKN